MVFYHRSKHIDMQSRFTCNLVKEQRTHLEYIPTKDMIADLFTKSLARAQHEQLSEDLGLF